MQVVFFSNFLNHHQLPFCLKMQELTDGNFYFVATEKTPKERLDMGYEDMNEKYPFVVKAYQDNQKAVALAKTSDLMVIGSAPKIYAKERLKTHKIMFRYSERVQKEGFGFRTWASIIKNNTIPEMQNVYLLCAGAFAARDFNLAGAYLGKSYKWGYFPKCNILNNIEDFINNKRKNKIIWVGRFLDWKHPEKAVFVAQKLLDDNIDFEIEMIGGGPEKKHIKRLVKEYNLQEKVKLADPLPFDKVRKKMDEASILLFTSDKQEGWGAVLNEAMNSACITISDARIGSVPYLIKNSQNGYCYRNDDELYEIVKKVLSPKEKDNDKMMIAAYKTIAEIWNADVAAGRLIKLYKNLINNNNEDEFKDGPCSKAKIISERWRDGDI